MAEQEPDFLDDMATGGEAPEPELEAAPEPEPQPEPAAETVEPPAQPEPEAPTAPEATKDQHVPLAALRAEREKRQRLERQLQELQAKPQEPMPDFFEAPEVHLQSVAQQTQQRMFMALEEMAREQYADFDEVAALVVEAAKENPLIQQQVLNAANPALAAYKLGKQLQERERMQDPEAYRQQIEAELRQKLEAEYAAKAAAKAQTAAAVPPDLSQARNANGQFTPAAGSAIDELFPRN